ncbi:Asp-tRNA(Asn)/Glu-tRNA(Gln) amidotransferase subunit GatB [Candidatus Uhrbacteria bacterium]|nr:Asp-tRNA(Asn)/Glu-tRNA(Gln) amidotransferase subunit GatB [Candidatus Uhrbacteria bacterium]
MLLPIIGLEIHVRLKTKSKIFCACPNVPEDTPINTAICPVCTGQPGALPAVNDQAIRLGVRTGLALGCTIPNTAHFDRKNYFYPDLPKGYQISQYDFPICINGMMMIEDRRIGITRAHLEEDAAKNIHDGGSGKTLVDFNRAGNPLLEIVTEPDFRSPAEAKLFLQELQAILRAIGASDADMEKGYMRCDANVSLLEIDENGQRLGSGLNPKIEIKNLNSFRAVERALMYEIERQRGVYEKGEIPQGATRGWDENKGETFEQRLKETSADYRYFPEPDLPPLDLTSIREEEKDLPELPSEKRFRFMDEYGFSAEDAKFFVSDEAWSAFAEQVMSELKEWKEMKHPAKLAGGWMTSKYTGLLAQKHLSLSDSKITPENFAELLKLIDDGLINSANAQKLLALMIDTGSDPSHLLEEHHLGQNEDPEVLTKTVAMIIQQNEDQVKQVKAGKLGVIKWFVGGVMKATEGRANPEKAEAEVRKQLGV